jgi:hypothetical protein
MFACTLKTKPVTLSSFGMMVRPPVAGWECGGGAKSAMKSSISSMP